MKCTCGYTKFSERIQVSTGDVQRWARTTGGTGLGAMPLGLGLGGGVAEAWGRYTVPYTRGTRILYCANCKRKRSEVPHGGFTLLGMYVDTARIYVLCGDVEKPVSGLSVKFTLNDLSYEVQLEASSRTPFVLSSVPEITAYDLPSGAISATAVLTARLPLAAESGFYGVHVVDSRTGASVSAGETVFLEAFVQMILPNQADLNGAPRSWLRSFDADFGPQQGQGVPVEAVPFDKCAAVLEYDAALGTAPSAQGWAHAGAGAAGDYSVTDAGTLRATTTVASYWTAAYALGSVPDAVHAYSRAAVKAANSLGFVIRGARGANLSQYKGVRVSLAPDGIASNVIDAGSPVVSVLGTRAPGWTDFGGSERLGVGALWTPESMEQATYGSGAVASTTEMNARFGDLTGDNLTAWIRNVVVSAAGRFVRARFSAFSPVSTPVLRLYLSRGRCVDPTNTARFVVKYGTGADPYATLSYSTTFTTAITGLNTILEIPVTLTGLTANAPFWFSLERDWAHGNDTLSGTVYLHHATVRSV